MNIIFNGDQIGIEAGTTLKTLLENKQLNTEKRMALLVNGDIISKDKTSEVILQENDTIEAVTLAAGG